VKGLVAAAALLAVTSARAGSLSTLGVGGFKPSLPVFGGGEFVNFLGGDRDALTNASAHVAWSLAVPLAGQYVGGRKGLWIAGLAWMAVSLGQEAFFHAPPNPGRGYPAEVRADLLTRLVPTAFVLGWDLLRGGPPPAPASDVPRGPMRVERTGAPKEGAPEPAARWMCPDPPATQPARAAL